MRNLFTCLGLLIVSQVVHASTLTPVNCDYGDYHITVASQGPTSAEVSFGICEFADCYSSQLNRTARLNTATASDSVYDVVGGTEPQTLTLSYSASGVVTQVDLRDDGHVIQSFNNCGN